MHCCKELRRLRRVQFKTVARLFRDLRQNMAEGNELYVSYLRDEIKVARNLSRLVHKH